MEQLFKSFAGYVAEGIEVAAAVLIVVGAVEAFWGMIWRLCTGKFVAGTRREIWVRFGVWLLLGLEFELAADIIRSAIAPNWNDIGQLAAIAAIRTFLNYFLEKDIDKYEAAGGSEQAASIRRPAA
jgi:uncharacterized membrane protein